MTTIQTQTVYDIERIAENRYSVQQIPQPYDVAYTPFAVVTTSGGGGSTDIEKITGEPISGHKAICVKADGLVYYADADDEETSGVIGISRAAAGTGEYVPIRTVGELQHSGWSWVVGEPVYVGLTGGLTQSVTGAEYVIIVGIATVEDTINIEVQQPIFIG